MRRCADAESGEVVEKFFLRYCGPYRWLIRKLFGKYPVERLSIPMSIYADFECCYLGFDKDGNVHKGFANLFDAIKNRGDLGLTVIYDRE